MAAASETPTMTSRASTNVVAMKPIVKDIKVQPQGLTFTLLNSNVSFANALRRVIISNIPTVVFRTTPYEKSMTRIITNTSRLTNEILNQRISCIPIHINDDSTYDIDSLVVECNKKNESDTIQYVTTADLRIRDTKIDKYLSKADRDAIFPPDPITGDHIIITRLRPQISATIPGEACHFESKMTRSTAKEDSCFNVTSTCSYACTSDVVQQKEHWRSKASELKKNGLTEDEIDYEEKNWYLNDAKRVFVPNSFDFVIQSIGVFDEKNIVEKACSIMIEKCDRILEMVSTQSLQIEESKTSMKNAFDITLVNEDYTLGKCIEFVLHELYYKEKTLSFVGFLKNHPYDEDSLIRIQTSRAVKNKGDIYLLVSNATHVVKEFYTSLQEQM